MNENLAQWKTAIISEWQKTITPCHSQ